MLCFGEFDSNKKNNYKIVRRIRTNSKKRVQKAWINNSHNVKLTLFNNGNQHTHDQILEQQTKTGINEATKHYIQTCLDQKVVLPKTKIASIRQEQTVNSCITLPTSIQLNNYLQKLKKKVQMVILIFPALSNISIYQIEYESIPVEDIDKPNFITYQVKIDEYSVGYGF